MFRVSQGISARARGQARRHFVQRKGIEPMRWEEIRACTLLKLTVPPFLSHPSIEEQVRLRRLDIAALGTILLCNASILLLLRIKRRREQKLPSCAQGRGRLQPSVKGYATPRWILPWGVLAAGAIMGTCYSWLSGDWIILPVFLAGGCWMGLRTRKLLRNQGSVQEVNGK